MTVTINHMNGNQNLKKGPNP